MAKTGSGLMINGVPFDPRVDNPNDPKYSQPMAAPSSLMINGVPFDPRVDNPNDPKYDGIANPETRPQVESNPNTPTGITGGMGGPGVTGASGAGDIQSSLDSMYDAQQQSAEARIRSATEGSLAALAKSLGSALTALDTAQLGTKDVYTGKRNEAAAQSDIGAMNWAQKAASLGIKGGAAMQPEIYRTVGLQNALTQLGQSEAQQNAAYDMQRALAKSAYETDVANVYNTQGYDLAAAGAQIDAAATQSAINELMRQANLQASQTSADKQSWLDTIGRHSSDYQAEINRVQGNNDPTDDWQIPYLQAARQDKINAQNQQAQQTFFDTIGQYAGRYNEQADIFANDNDPSNDQYIPYLRAAAAQQASGRYSGGYSGGGTSTPGAAPEASNLFRDMQNSGNPASFLYSNYSKYNLAYSGLNAVLDEYRRWASEQSAGAGSPFSDATGSDRYAGSGQPFSQAEYSQFAYSLNGFRSQNGRRAAIQDAMAEGKITEAQAMALMNQWGIAYE